MKIHSETAWKIASEFSHVLASDTRTLAGMIDEALAAEREACAKVAEASASDHDEDTPGGFCAANAARHAAKKIRERK